MARALVFKPQLVLMDEPLGALDKQLREHMQIELKALHRQLGVTFVYVTHDQGEALTMSDRVAVFDQGIIQQLDPVGALYESPQNAFVASFIGDSNRLTGQIGQRDGDRCTMTLAGGHVLSGMRIGEAAPGQTATASIRPERMRLVDAADTQAAGNVLRGLAAGIIYFGDHVRLQCEFTDQAQCFVKVPLDTPALARLAPGQPVALAFEAEHLRIFS